jgi:hypothetical protein
MGLKTFDIAPEEFKDGGVATPDKEHWSSNEEVPTDAEKAVADAETMADADAEHEKQNSGLKVSMKTKLALHMMRVEIPSDAIDEINKYIDENIVTQDEKFGETAGNTTTKNSLASGLVGQIKQNSKSAQLVFPITDEEEGSIPSQVKTIIDQCARTYLKNGHDIDAVVDAFEAWSVHSYSGDYNPLHDHGVATPFGLSCILYLKVPEAIEKKHAEDQNHLNNNSGGVDGFTYFSWGSNGRADTKILRPATDEYVKPEKGVMYLFPNWLRHSVMPFYGDGERRTFSTNINVIDKLHLKKMGKTSPEDQENYIKSLRRA